MVKDNGVADIRCLYRHSSPCQVYGEWKVWSELMVSVKWFGSAQRQNPVDG
jgi:hypothetical protein